MLNIFKRDPVKKLLKEYQAIMAKAVEAQRRGDIRTFSRLSQEADKIDKKITELKSQM